MDISIQIGRRGENLSEMRGIVQNEAGRADGAPSLPGHAATGAGAQAISIASP